MKSTRKHRLSGPPGRARVLRRHQTDAEGRLWSELRNRQLEGFKFRRQHRIGPFITDFACVEIGLVVELDGDQHAWRAHYDELRTLFLSYAGFEVLRFWNNELYEDLDGVLEEIRLACLARCTPSPARPAR